jgi:iron complex outermembrane receptor protein
VNLDFGPQFQVDYRFDRSLIDQAGSFGQLYRLTPTGAFDPAAPGGALYAGLAPYVSQDRQTEADVDAPSSEKVRVEGHSLTLSWNLSETQQLKSISAYRHLSNEDAADYDGTPQAIAATQRLTNFHQLSQELQWLGRWQRLTWVGGLYYYGDDGYTDNPQTYFFGGQNFDSQYGTRTKAYAAYGQVDYKLLDPLTLTAGLRYTREEKELDRIFGVSYGGGAYNYLIPSGTHADASFNATTPSFAINYQLVPQLNLYARYAEGFKSGGFNGEYSDTTQTSQQNIDETRTPFRPEKQRSLELGAKGSVFDNRVQYGAAVFQNKLTDLQESIFQATGAAASVIRNAGSATVHGIELEGAVVPIAGTRLSANYAYLDPRFDDFENAGQNVADNRAYVHTPKNSFNVVLDSRLAKYRWGTVKALADYAWTGSYYLYPYQLNQTDPTQPDANNTKVRSYGLLNLRLALTNVPLGNTFTGDLALWMRNATDEKVAANFIDFGPAFGNLTDAYFIDPRTFGITGTVHW